MPCQPHGLWLRPSIDRLDPYGRTEMSLAAADPVPLPEEGFPPPMSDGVGGRGLALSAVLHLVLGTVLVFGLPTLFSPHAPEEMPIAVQLVTMGPQTRASHPNPNMPQREAKLEPPLPGPPAEKPAPVPTPVRPAPPPTRAEAPPAPPAPAPPEPKPVPPAPSAALAQHPKQPELPPPPPLPEPKPLPLPPPPKPSVEAATPKPPPERPQQLARYEAKAEANKYNPGQFDALLRNLAAQDTPLSPEAPPQTIRVAAGRASAQPHAPLGNQLSASELDMVREQISRCWNIPAGARDAKDLVVEIRVVVLPDGNVQQATILDQGRAAADPFFRAAAESARRAFFNPLCRPLRLPPDKYEIWKDMTVDFSPKDLL
jgi:outer membrane biosynthesis protein TonB